MSTKKIRDLSFINPAKLPPSLWKITGLFLLFSMGINLVTLAQGKIKITGKITSEVEKEAIPGANVIVKGTTIGTTTDIDGNYALEVGENDILIISYIGFQQEEIPVEGRSVIDVVLVEDLTQLGEVVVIGYGTQQKKVVTAATVTVKSQDIQNTNSLRVEQALQGQTPGVQISSTSGQPGEGLKVRIRGTGTIGESDPLYVVDGVPTTDISYLNPSMVERVDVLKDAASAAIYGARAANGVVLITTKKGKEGKMQIALDSYYGIQNLYKKLPLLDAQEYAIIMNEANVNSGQAPVYSQSQINAFGEGTDWIDEATNENAPIQNHSLTVSGGNEKSVFSTALGYFQQEGIFGGKANKSNFERLSFTINSDHKAYKDIVRVGQNLTYTNVNRRGLRVGGIYNNSLRGLFNTTPVFPVYDANGDFAKSPVNADEVNPIAAMYYQDFNKTITDRVLGNVYAEIQPIEGLIFRSDIGADISLTNYNSFDPTYDLSQSSRNLVNSAQQTSSRNIRWNWDNTLRYSRSFGNHNLDVLIGISAQESRDIAMGATKEGLIFDDFDHAYLTNGTIDTTVIAYGYRTDYALYSQFGRLNYNFNQKYLLSATVRRDGSSNFGPDQRYGIFPSVSAGWVLSEEGFLRDVTSISQLKLRASWGQNGNDRVPIYGPNGQMLGFPYMATLSSNDRDYYFGSSDVKYIGTSPDKIANPDLKWETSEQIDIGIDARIFKNIDISMDYYIKTTKDWLIVAPVPDLVGTDAPWINGGAIENKGFEFQVGYNNTFGDLSVGVSANAAFNQNKVTEINNSEKIIHGDPNLIQGLSEINRAEVGKPVGYFWGYKVAGIFQNEEEIQNYRNNEKVVQPSAVPGDVKFVDLNGDGSINDLDKTMIGDPNPDATYGFNVNLGYKGFDLSIYTYGMAGNQNMFGVRNVERYYFNYTTDILNRWHGEGTSNSVPRVTNGSEANKNYLNFSELYIQDASFFRIKSLNIGYDFSRLLPKSPFTKLRLYVSANNLFTFTKYKGMDPEIGFGDRTGNRYNMTSGVDVGYYPQPRSFMTGVNIQF
ncbi:MAG TPA: TonB-dependent receptor [Cytophagales bacterium]|nr:TonB-dependent receptor [Cytophagales bacterium]